MTIEERTVFCLAYLIQQVEEDCPRKIMTKHLKGAIEDAKNLLEEIANNVR
jgi:hypothetical protein